MMRKYADDDDDDDGNGNVIAKMMTMQKIFYLVATRRKDVRRM